MGFFDFESAERAELNVQPIQGRGDTLRALLDHRWLNFALIIFLIAIVAQIHELLAIVGFMLIIVFIAWLWSRSSLRGLVYTRTFPYRRLFPDEHLDIHITVENRKLLPISWLQIEDAWPAKVGPTGSFALPISQDDPDLGYLINTYSLRWYERIRRHFTLEMRQRGVFEIGPAHLLSGDPFSLFDRKIMLEDRHEVIVVYPRIRPLEDLGLPLKDPFGDRRVQRRLFEDLNRTMGIRDYVPQDSLRHVHWKATARTGSLKTRVYEPTRSLRTVLCLNVATFEQYWRGVWPDMLEYEMEVAASLANWALDNGHSVGMIANSTLAHADQPFRVPPGRSPDQLSNILQGLAAVSYFVSANFDRFLIEEAPHLPWGATLVLITPFMNDPIAGAILRLRDSGRRLVLIGLGKQALPFIPGILSYHLPIPADAPPSLESADEQPDNDFVLSDTLTPRQRYLMRRAREEADHGINPSRRA